ncbi:cyclic nucleotide-binding domain-containing protein [archaeon]|nr:MAG: cyclic nucleotide-binding domain-containing protein [archaeon]
MIVASADKSVVFATLGPGAYVGESCLLEVSERTASVFAVGYVDTYVLSSESFFEVNIF